MEDTYTYIARSADDPARVATFTLHNHSMSVGIGAPLEHVERALQSAGGEAEGEARPRFWLKPLAVSLPERGTGAFRVADVNAGAEGDWLQVTAWFRAGGLRLAPVTLIKGRVDNPEAALALVEELSRRKAAGAGPLKFLEVLDYWATWFLAGFLLIGLLEVWRRSRLSKER
jgi:hypothetical protein